MELTNKTEYGKRKVHIDIIRVVAIVLVVLHHMDITGLYYQNTDNCLTFLCSTAITVLVQIDVPLFFIVSGALLLNKDEADSVVWKKRIPRMLAVLVIFSALQYFFRIYNGRITNPSLVDFIKRLLSNNIQQTYWFLYAYIAFLIILPIMRRMVKSMTLKDLLFLVILSLTYDVIVGYLMHYVSWFDVTDAFWDSIRPLMSSLIYWLIGGIAEKYYEELQAKRWIRNISIIIGGIWLLIPAMVSLIGFAQNGLYDTYLIEHTVVSAPIVVYFALVLFCKESSAPLNCVAKLGKYCFGVYLTEQFLREILNPLYIAMTQHMFGVIASFIFLLVVLLFAFVISFVMKKVPKFRELF